MLSAIARQVHAPGRRQQASDDAANALARRVDARILSIDSGRTQELTADPLHALGVEQVNLEPLHIGTFKVVFDVGDGRLLLAALHDPRHSATLLEEYAIGRHAASVCDAVAPVDDRVACIHAGDELTLILATTKHAGRIVGRWDALDDDQSLQLMRAVGRLHANGIAHGDIHRENVLVDEHGRVRIIDFAFIDCLHTDVGAARDKAMQDDFHDAMRLMPRDVDAQRVRELTAAYESERRRS